MPDSPRFVSPAHRSGITVLRHGGMGLVPGAVASSPQLAGAGGRPSRATTCGTSLTRVGTLARIQSCAPRTARLISGRPAQSVASTCRTLPWRRWEATEIEAALLRLRSASSLRLDLHFESSMRHSFTSAAWMGPCAFAPSLIAAFRILLF